MGSDNQILFVLANHDFRDEEYKEPERILTEAGAECKIAALVSGECVGVAGTLVTADYELGEVNPEEFLAVIFVGGTGVENYLKDELVHSLAKSFFSADKLVCAICWAPVILANAGILRGKKATVWAGAKEDLEIGGACFTGEAVTSDGNIITANGPEAAEAFGQEIAKRLF